MKPSLRVSTLALAWSQCLHSQNSAPPASQQNHIQGFGAWRKKEKTNKSDTGIEAKQPLRVLVNVAAAVAILICAAPNLAWSGVPHGIQRSNTSQHIDTSVHANAAQYSTNDECARMAFLEKEIAALRARVDDMLAQLRVRSVDGK